MKRGFTLVELLVAVMLTMLIMLMFTQIFQITTGAMQKSKGLAENDQKARLLTNLLRSDVEHRTFRNLYPYYVNEPLGSYTSADDPRHPENRRGYFYISENDPDDDTDDVLQFTIQAEINEDPVYGKTVTLADMTTNPNQPDFDDRNSQPNQTGQSHFAEVSYFLRNGLLYRRVLLIRQPADTSFTDPEPQSGSSGFGTEYVTSAYPNSFWNDFDYSAHQAAGGNPQFNGFAMLANNAGPQSLGVPGYRFGHDFGSGTPKEYVRVDETDHLSLTYIGRYTQEETSHPSFLYPSNTLTYPNPMAPDPGTGGTPDIRLGTVTTAPGAGGVVQYRDPNNQAWETYRGDRRSEDMVLPNVHAFDIKVWDDALGAFVDLGHSGTTGTYALASRANSAYGSRSATENRVFDTWHPSLTMSVPPTPPPFDPLNPSDPTEHIPLRIFRITLRYEDVTTGQLREQILTFSTVQDEQT